jgi:Leucine-rich repeat (LRR) protein
VFEAAFNALTSLPAGFGKLAQLETLLLAHNSLTSVAPLASLTNLTSVTLDANALTGLDDMDLSKKARKMKGCKGYRRVRCMRISDMCFSPSASRLCPSQPRLALLSCRSNALRSLPAEVGDCPLLAQLLLRGNALRDVPFELCTLKKLRDLELEENPLDDPKIKKMLLKPASFVKEARACGYSLHLRSFGACVCASLLTWRVCVCVRWADHAVFEEARQDCGAQGCGAAAAAGCCGRGCCGQR